MKVRIKIGARVMQDRGFGRWPSCYPPSGCDFDPTMIFDAEKRRDGGWECRANGFGRRIWLGEQGGYGSGSVTVIDYDGVEVVE